MKRADIEGRDAFIAAVDAVKRQTDAREVLLAHGPHPFKVRQFLQKGRVLVHASTAIEGWQATFFDAEGEPYAHIEDRYWSRLIGRLRWHGIDWTTAEMAP